MTSADTGSIWDHPTVPPTVLARGAELGRFRVEELIGRGGMGEVWKAHDPVRNNWVVIKVLPREMLQDPENLERLRDSFRQIQGFQHQHICPVFDLIPDERAGWYLVMKFVEGTTLSYYQHRTLKEVGTFPPARVVSILQPIASALDYAHQQGVVHRDVKPQNILVSADGSNPQLVDFGLAATIHRSMSRAGIGSVEICGSYPYMAPEQWKGSPQDGRADQYALAVVAYELLGGHPPFDSPDASVMRMCVLQDPPPAIGSLPDAANRSLLRALAKTPAERFGSCQEFLADLSAALTKPDRRPPTAPQMAKSAPQTPIKSERPVHPQQKRKEVIFTAALLAAVCVMGWLFRGDLFPQPAANLSSPAVAPPVAPPTGTAAPATLPTSVAPVASAPGTGTTSVPTTTTATATAPMPTAPSPMPMPTIPLSVTTTTPSPVPPSTAPVQPSPSPAAVASVPAPASIPMPVTPSAAPKPAAINKLIPELTEAKQVAERAKQDSQNRNADRYAQKLWNAADTDKKSADELYAQGKFAEALDKYRVSAKGFYQAVTAAESAARLASSSQKTLQQLATLKAHLLASGADKILPKEFQAASRAHDDFLKSMQAGDYASAADALAKAETGYEQCRQQAEGMARVNAAQSEFDQLVSALDPKLLGQYGGENWGNATQEIAAARGAEDTPRLERALAAATKLVPDIREKIQTSEVDKWKAEGDHAKVLELLWPSWSQLKPPARKLCLDAAPKVPPSWWLRRAESMRNDAVRNQLQAAMVNLKLADACYRTPGHVGAQQHIREALKSAKNVTDTAGSKSAYLASWISLEIAEDCVRRGDTESAKIAAKQAKLDLDSMADPTDHNERQIRPFYQYLTLLKCAAVYWATGDKENADSMSQLAYSRYCNDGRSTISFSWDMPLFQAIFVYARSGDATSLAKMSKFFEGGTVRLSHQRDGRPYQSLKFPEAFSDQGHNTYGNVDIYHMLLNAEMAVQSAQKRNQEGFDLHRRKVEAMIDANHFYALGGPFGSLMPQAPMYKSEIHTRIAIADATQGDIESAVSRMLDKTKISVDGLRGSARATVGRLCAEQKQFEPARNLFDDGSDDTRTLLLTFEIARMEGAENLEATLDWLASLKSPAHQVTGLAGLSTIPAK